MLAIYKFVNNENEKENRISIKTSEIDPITGAVGKKYPIGVLLSPKKEDIKILAKENTYTFKANIKATINLNTGGRSTGGVNNISGNGTYQITQTVTALDDADGKEKIKKDKNQFKIDVKKLTFPQLLEKKDVGNLKIEVKTPLKIIQQDASTSRRYENPEIDITQKTSQYVGSALLQKPEFLKSDYKGESSSIDNPLTKFFSNDAFKLLTKNPQPHYIRFGALLEFILDNVIIKIKNTNNDPIFDIDVDEDNTVMYSLPNQISLDPRVCLVRNDKFDTAGGTINKGITNIFGNTNKLEPFKLVDDGETNDNAAYSLNIYLNFNFILECLKADEKGNVSVYQLISNICTGLNKALGGINNLEPIIDETKNTLRIIDTTPIPDYSAKSYDKKEDEPYALQIYGYDKIANDYISNFVRKVDLKTAITPEYATMITVGATAGGYVKGTEATAFSKWNIGLTDRFKEELLPPDGIKNNTDKNEAATNYVDIFYYPKGRANRFGINDFGSGMKLSDNIIEKNLSIVTEYYKWLIAYSSPDDKLSGGTVGFIPFKLGLTLDGISGIKIYNVLRINTEFLPKAYGKTVDLIVTGVSHRLNNNDWETSIEATVMPKTGEMALVTITAKAAATITNNSATKNPSGYGDVVGCGAPEKYDISKITKNDKVNQTQAKKLLKKVIAKVIADTNGASRSVCAAYVKRIAKKYFEYYNLNRAVNINQITSWRQSKVSAGGSHAKNKDTHDWLIKDLGYTRIILGKNLSTSEARSLIDAVTYNIGDIISYWDHSGNTKGHQIYGHIQIYEGNNSWRSDFKHSSFVYKSYTGCWDIIYLQAPNKAEPILNE